MNILLLSGILALSHLGVLEANRVLELNDRFSEARKDGTNWFVMFYAPWCGHCKNMEPAWNQVAQTFYRTPIYVGRVDCTRYPNLAREFSVKGFPTVLFIKGDQTFSYNGERTREAFVEFALRMSRPAVQELQTSDQFHSVTRTQPVLFIYVGTMEGPLWDAYNSTAHEFQSQASFYRSECATMVDKETASKLPAVFVHKGAAYEEFSQPLPDLRGEENSVAKNPADYDDLHSELRRWVNKERFPVMSKVTHGNFHQALRTGKFIVLAVLEENEAGVLTDAMEGYKETLEKFAVENREKFHAQFMFGWSPSAELPSTFALTALPAPSIIVINSTTFQYHLMEQSNEILSSELLADFLDEVLAGNVPAYGGTGLGTRLYRVFYDASSSVRAMWQGNPILTTVLFGLPLGFLSLICYSICCADFVDDTEEEQVAENHEKED